MTTLNLNQINSLIFVCLNVYPVLKKKLILIFRVKQSYGK